MATKGSTHRSKDAERKLSDVSLHDQDKAVNDDMVVELKPNAEEGREDTLVEEFNADDVVNVEPDQNQNLQISSQNQNLDIVVTRKVSKSSSVKTDDGVHELEETEERAEKDVMKLQSAIENTGDLNLEDYITVLIPVSNSYRQLLRKTYREKYDKDLLADLDIESAGELEHFFKSLVRTPEEFLAHWLRTCVKTRQYTTIIEILTAWAPTEVNNTKNIYLTDFKISFEKDLENYLDDLVVEGIKDVMTSLASLQRNDELKELDEDITKSEADELSKGDKSFMDVLLNNRHSKAQLAAIFQDYKARHYLTVADSIDINFDDEIGELLKIIASCLQTTDDYSRTSIGISYLHDKFNSCAYARMETKFYEVNIVEDPIAYFASELHRALNGNSTNNQRISMILIGRHQVDLAIIVSNYEESYKRSIADDIDIKCSGYYKDAFKLMIARFGR